MASSAIRHPDALNIEAFLAFADRQSPDEHWELHDGVPRLMVGGTARHARIAGNIDHALFATARARGCEVFRDFLLEANEFNAFEPDVMIRCGGIDDRVRRTADPVVVFEVHSPSTMGIDRGLKFDRYRAIPSLQQIVFVYQDSYRVEAWTRQDGEWEEEPTVLTAIDVSLQIPAIGTSLAMSDIYLDVTPSPLGSNAR